MTTSKHIALVTGGMGGIGTAICRRLADAGMTVVTTFSRPGKENDWLAAQAAEGYTFHAYHCDVTDTDACLTMVSKVLSEVGTIDVLINNAGIARDGTFRKMGKDAWDAVMATNLDSLYNVTKPVLEAMLESGWGRIINISSINGQKGQFGQTNYAAAKAGIHGFSMALAQEVARKGITVNTVSPGYIGTEMMLAIKEDILQQIITHIPVGRLGKPEEVASVVAFLASDGAAFITGANIAMNGGQHMM